MRNEVEVTKSSQQHMRGNIAIAKVDATRERCRPSRQELAAQVVKQRAEEQVACLMTHSRTIPRSFFGLCGSGSAVPLVLSPYLIQKSTVLGLK